MQKKFLSNLLLIILLNLLVKPIAIFWIDAGVQERVGTETYGLYFSLLNLSFLFNILSDLGLNNFTTRALARHPKVFTKYAGQVMGLRLVLFVCYLFITLLTGLIAGYKGEALYFLAILAFNQMLTVMIAHVRSHFGGLHLFRSDAFISVLDRALLILLCGSIFFTGMFEIEWFIWLQTACYSVTLLIGVILLVRHMGIPKIQYRKVVSFMVLRQSFPFALLVLLMMLYTRSDVVLLERLHPNGALEAGIYAKGFRLLDAFFMFGMIFANLLFPMFSRALKEQKEKVLPLLQTGSRLLIGGALLVACTSYFHSEAVLGWIYNSEITEASFPFRMLMWGFVGMCTTLIFGTLLTANGDLRALNITSAIGLVLNVALNLILISNLGANGSALAFLITQCLMGLIQIGLCMRRFRFSFTQLAIHRYLLFTSFMFGMQFVPLPQHFALTVLLLAGVSGLFIFKLIDVKELSKVFKENI
jgi:O-antigen/teichoic acid export membrane protein